MTRALALALLLLPAACASSRGEYVARVGDVELRADLRRSGDDPGAIEVRVVGPDAAAITAFEAVLYDDLDGDGEVDEGERVRTSYGETDTPTTAFRVAAFTVPAGLTNPRLRAEVVTTGGTSVVDVSAR